MLVCTYITEALAESGQNPPREEAGESGGNKYSEMFKLKSLHFMAVFIVIYIGVEVTLGGEAYNGMAQVPCATPDTHHLATFVGWIVTYVIDLRGGGPSAGYISSGFFGCM